MKFRASPGHSKQFADVLNKAVIALLALRIVWDQENKKETGDDVGNGN